MMTAAYLLIQCTWGALQTLLGLGLFLIHYSCPHQWFHGAIHTCWKKNSGVSLGMFIFTPEPLYVPPNSRTTAHKYLVGVSGVPECHLQQQSFAVDRAEVGSRLQVHEYGHTLQSLFLGPFYLLVIGIPSLVWFRASRFRKLRAEKQVLYSSFYTERWADWLGEKATGQKSDGS